jgi:hypothetical protein
MHLGNGGLGVKHRPLFSDKAYILNHKDVGLQSYLHTHKKIRFITNNANELGLF